jgi:hypothetical protein
VTLHRDSVTLEVADAAQTPPDASTSKAENSEGVVLG